MRQSHKVVATVQYRQYVVTSQKGTKRMESRSAADAPLRLMQ
jgi:hypothetical protein